ncbi:hypothetical protein KD33_07070 [Clostridium sp. NCR]|nr:hypothetical protein KD33_07070 [Clostridium sp. NCR]
MKKIEILGEEYEILIKKPEEDTKLKSIDGYCDSSINTIVVCDFEEDENSIMDLERYKREVIRHELIHAFLNESGLRCSSDWARNEEMVDYFAIQLPKIVEVMRKLDILY